jgi:STE24 endopeptidase
VFDPLVVALIAAVWLADGRAGGVEGSWGVAMAWSWGVTLVIVVGSVALACAVGRGVAYRRWPIGAGWVARVSPMAVVASGRALLVGWQVWGMLGLGFVGAARSAVGDAIVLGEAVALLPGVVGLVAIDAARYGRFGRGAWGGAVERFRQRGALEAAVFLVVVGWVGLGGAVVGWAGGGSGVSVGWGLVAWELVGVAMLFLAMPWLVVLVWRTRPVGSSGLRERLLGVCESAGVRVRAVREWRPPGRVANGAMVGVVPWSRVILLSDGLVERMPSVEIEAVMAHEAGHARLGHLAWLAAATVGVFGSVWFGSMAVLWGVSAAVGLGGAEAFSGWVAALPAGLMALRAFGRYSRAFEREADAFAAGVMGDRLGEDAWGGAVVGSAVMASALERVALLNGLDPERFGFRHGTIAGRLRALRGSVGGGSVAGGVPTGRGLRRRALAWAVAAVAGQAIAAWIGWIG